MANNPNEPETFHEVPASKYWYLGDKIGAVPKGFFKFWTPFIIVSTAITTAVACLTDWWQILAVRLGTFVFVDNWIISFPAIGIAGLILYVRRNMKEKKKLKDQILSLREVKKQK